MSLVYCPLVCACQPARGCHKSNTWSEQFEQFVKDNEGERDRGGGERARGGKIAEILARIMRAFKEFKEE